MILSEVAFMAKDRSRRESSLQRAIEQDVVSSSNDLIIPDTIEVLSALQDNCKGKYIHDHYYYVVVDDDVDDDVDNVCCCSLLLLRSLWCS